MERTRVRVAEPDERRFRVRARAGRVPRRRLVTLLAVGALLVATAGGVARAGQSGAGSDNRPVARQRAGAASTYTVRPGDTLWGIAARVTGGAGDPRPVVDAIIDANGIAAGALLPGQVLVLPPA